MSTNDEAGSAVSSLETPDSASIDTDVTVADDPDTLTSPIAMGIRVDVVDGERRVGLAGVPSLGVAADYGALLDFLSELDITSEVQEAIGEVGTLYYDPETDAVACEFEPAS